MGGGGGVIKSRTSTLIFDLPFLASPLNSAFNIALLYLFEMLGFLSRLSEMRGRVCRQCLDCADTKQVFLFKQISQTKYHSLSREKRRVFSEYNVAFETKKYFHEKGPSACVFL